jgi:hypothetical protein
LDCDRVAELLPWMMNGTLKGSEQEMLREHLAVCQHCQQELAETRFAWTVQQQHLPVETLINLAYKRPVIATERSLFERHLAACADCAEQLEMVKESVALEAEDVETADTGREVMPVVAKRTGWWQRTQVWQYGALAASLLLIIASVGWLQSWQHSRALRAGVTDEEKALQERLTNLEKENERLRRAEAELNQRQNQSSSEITQLQAQIKEAQARVEQERSQTNRELAQVKGRANEGGRAPQVNILALDIYPLGFTQRAGNAAANEIKIPSNVKALTLILNSQASSDYQSYSIEMRNSQGRLVWSAQNLARNSTNDYTISIPADYLTEGSYTINIFGTAAGQRTKVESYQIKVRKS